MARDWRCVVRRHDWRVVEVEKPDRDKYAECTRCGKRDYVRVMQKSLSPKWHGAIPPGSG